MRAEISSFARMLTYPELTDAPHCAGREHINGLLRDVVFMDHRFVEDRGSELAEDASKTNSMEAESVVEVVKYLLKQGYKSSQVTVLTPYLGQLRLVCRLIAQQRQALGLDAELNELDQAEIQRVDGEAEPLDGPDVLKEVKISQRIRVSTIDNYQGEECDIIIISLVRSNQDGNIGFLKEPERVNVMLTRAKLGMILLGNSETLLRSKGKSMWTKIFENFDKVGFKGPGLPVVCATHMKRSLPFSALHFQNVSPDGGCAEPCSFRFGCGHICPSKCHGHGYEHKICTTLVYSKCPSGHVITEKCLSGRRTRQQECLHCVRLERINQVLLEAKQEQERLESDQLAKVNEANMSAVAEVERQRLEFQRLEDPKVVQVCFNRFFEFMD
jgi:hypothetical protein